MGNAVPGMPSMPLDDIKGCATEVMKTFTPVYIKSYAIGLIKKLKAEADASIGRDSDAFQLLDPPVPSDILQTGWMTKMGAVQRNWKQRWFVATNQADNFRIFYFEKPELAEDLSKKKGVIQPCGYRVKRLDKPEEIKEFGECALTLKPYGRRRQWFFKCKSEKDAVAWLATLSYAARRAEPPLNPDPVMRFAFKRAYRMTRWRLDVWDWYSYDCTEEELLGQLVVDRCEEDCMAPVYDAIPSGRLEYKIRSAVQGVLDKTVGAAVGALWKGVSKTIDGQKETVESKVREQLGPLFEAEAQLKARVQSAIVGQITPTAAKIAAPILRPIIDCLMSPLVAAYRALCVSYYTRVGAIVDKGITTEALAELVHDTRLWWGCMRPALVYVYKALREGWEDDKPDTAAITISVSVNLGDILDCFQNVSPWQVEEKFESGLRNTMNRAVYTFVHLLEASSLEADVDPRHTLTSVLRMMLHDSKKQVLEEMTAMFMDVIKPPFVKAVDKVLKPVLGPLESAIPSPLKTLLDIEEMANDIIDDVLQETIAASVKPAAEPLLSQYIDTVPGVLGFTDW